SRWGESSSRSPVLIISSTRTGRPSGVVAGSSSGGVCQVFTISRYVGTRELGRGAAFAGSRLKPAGKAPAPDDSASAPVARHAAAARRRVRSTRCADCVPNHIPRLGAGAFETKRPARRQIEPDFAAVETGSAHLFAVDQVNRDALRRRLREQRGPDD